ncbi:ABC transporter substrate-binding protein [Microlunatus speluncae]|uniref:ABC transporter substrate-binding protein n=1 Tax=Microlunatus speluncae TaxID=2594267 RepID=UPI001C2D971B|nr:extracellular solute-binding protein [Microlunatus speluncae]
MSGLTRRRFLMGSSALAMTAVAAGCGGGGGGTGTTGGGGAGGLRWWDHFSSFQKLNDDWAAKQAEALGVAVTHTYNDASKAPEALQLANQAKQLPDVYSNVVGLPLAALVKDNWVRELEISEEVLGALPKGLVSEGITSIDGKLYGLPLFTFRQYTAVTWFNTELITKGGLDPANPPKTYDEFRDACAKLKGAGVVPMVLALGADGGRVEDEMDDMAQTGGFEGYQGLKFATGEYAYHDDAYVNGIEFWKELYDTQMMLPGTNNFSVVNARTRFASGAAAYFIDGPWLPGGSRVLQEAFVPKIGGGQILTAEAGVTPMTYRGLSGPSYFVSGSSADPENATKIIESFMTDDYQKQMTAAMDQPPVNLDVVDSADVIEPYKKIINLYKEQVFQMPQAIVRNPDIAAVDAQRKPITPSLGQVMQGYLGGDITDLRAALKKLSDSYEADREQAIKASGADVSVDDYAFSDWKPGADYTYQK